MATCATCGNEYDNPLAITRDGTEYHFDSFECAIEKLAPRCAQCNCRIIGHGVQQGQTIYCCAHCAERDGVTGLVDRH